MIHGVCHVHLEATARVKVMIGLQACVILVGIALVDAMNHNHQMKTWVASVRLVSILDRLMGYSIRNPHTSRFEI